MLMSYLELEPCCSSRLRDPARHGLAVPAEEHCTGESHQWAWFQSPWAVGGRSSPMGRNTTFFCYLFICVMFLFFPFVFLHLLSQPDTFLVFWSLGMLGLWKFCLFILLIIILCRLIIFRVLDFLLALLLLFHVILACVL